MFGGAGLMVVVGTLQTSARPYPFSHRSEKAMQSLNIQRFQPTFISKAKPDGLFTN